MCDTVHDRAQPWGVWRRALIGMPSTRQGLGGAGSKPHLKSRCCAICEKNKGGCAKFEQNGATSVFELGRTADGERLFAEQTGHLCGKVLDLWDDEEGVCLGTCESQASTPVR